MTQYQKYLKDWTSERGITSFLGSDKPAFQQDWKEEKESVAKFGMTRIEKIIEKGKESTEGMKMGREDKDVPLPTTPKPLGNYPKLVDAKKRKLENFIKKVEVEAKLIETKGYKMSDGKKYRKKRDKLRADLQEIRDIGENYGESFKPEMEKYFQDKYGDGWKVAQKSLPTAFKDKYWNQYHVFQDLYFKAGELIKDATPY